MPGPETRRFKPTIRLGDGCERSSETCSSGNSAPFTKLHRLFAVSGMSRKRNTEQLVDRATPALDQLRFLLPHGGRRCRVNRCSNLLLGSFRKSVSRLFPRSLLVHRVECCEILHHQPMFHPVSSLVSSVECVYQHLYIQFRNLVPAQR